MTLIERWNSGGDNSIAICAAAVGNVGNFGSVARDDGSALAVLSLLNTGERAVALLESSSGFFILSLLAAAVAALVIEHVVSGD